MTYVNNRDVAHLGPILVPHLATQSAATACHPTRQAAGARSTCCTARTTTSSRRSSRGCSRDAAGPRGDGPLPRHAARHPRRGRSRRVGVGVRAGPLLDRGPRGLTGPRLGARSARSGPSMLARRRGARDAAPCAAPRLPPARAPGSHPAAAARRRSARSTRAAGARPDGRSTRTSCAPGDCALRGSRSTAASRRARWATR